MKKFCLILALTICSSLISCSNDLSAIKTKETEMMQTETETKIDEKTKEAASQYPAVCDKLSWEKINSFPISNENMTEDELRKLCVEFFAYCQSFAWTPSENYTYTVRSKKKDVTLKRGTVYGGLPYVSSGRGNIYRLMEYYDEKTGVVDIKKAGADPEAFGNQCSFGAFWAWARVVNSANFGGTSHLVAKNGFIPVGPYQYDFSISEFGSPNSPDICKANGEQTMFRSYAAMKPGDGLVNSNVAGHTMMCASEPVIVIKADGSIDGEESYFTYIHQASGWSEQKQSDGALFLAQTVPYSKKTFAETFRENYLPFTFAEFLGSDPVEKSETTFSHAKDTMTLDEMRAAEITSNYAISDVAIVVCDENGNALLTKSFFADKIDLKAFTFGSGIFPADLKTYAKENRTITINCRLATGETHSVYKGTLVP